MVFTVGFQINNMQKIKILYYFLFNQFYCFFLLLSKKDNPSVKAFMTFSGVLSLTTMEIYFLMEKLFNFDWSTLSFGGMIAVMYLFVLFFINYLIFERNNKSEQIRVHFEENEFLNRPLRMLITIGFILFPFVLMLVFWYDARVMKLFP